MLLRPPVEQVVAKRAVLTVRVAEELSNPFRNETITVALCQQTESEIIATTPALTVIAAALS